MNPFKFGTIVESEYFTDRIEETETLMLKSGLLIKESGYAIEDPFFTRWLRSYLS